MNVAEDVMVCVNQFMSTLSEIALTLPESCEKMSSEGYIKIFKPNGLFFDEITKFKDQLVNILRQEPFAIEKFCNVVAALIKARYCYPPYRLKEEHDRMAKKIDDCITTWFRLLFQLANQEKASALKESLRFWCKEKFVLPGSQLLMVKEVIPQIEKDLIFLIPKIDELVNDIESQILPAKESVAELLAVNMRDKCYSSQRRLVSVPKVEELVLSDEDFEDMVMLWPNSIHDVEKIKEELNSQQEILGQLQAWEGTVNHVSEACYDFLDHLTYQPNILREKESINCLIEEWRQFRSENPSIPVLAVAAAVTSAPRMS